MKFFTRNFLEKVESLSHANLSIDFYMKTQNMSFHDAVLKFSKDNGFEPEYIENDESRNLNLGKLLQRVKDSYILELYSWIKTVERLQARVRSTEMDKELEDELASISSRLINEIGMRVYIDLKGGEQHERLSF